MGNHMSKMAAGMGLAIHLRQYNATVDLKLRSQVGSNKGPPAQRVLKRCFPETINLNFTEADDFEPPKQLKHMQAVFDQQFDGINSNDPERVQADILAAAQYAAVNGNLTLYSAHFSMWDFYVDTYYDQIRQFFRYTDDDPFCCKERPYANETVFHYRQFTTEMPNVGIALGFDEASASELLEHILLPANATNVAILSRYQNEQLNAYADVLRDAGLSVRILPGQSGIQDFCFLKSAQHHVIGSARSTFFAWAALLSDAALVSAYSIDTPAQRKWAATRGEFVRQHYNWTNPKLVDRVVFPLIAQAPNATRWRGRGKY